MWGDWARVGRAGAGDLVRALGGGGGGQVRPLVARHIEYGVRPHMVKGLWGVLEGFLRRTLGDSYDDESQARTARRAPRTAHRAPRTTRYHY